MILVIQIAAAIVLAVVVLRFWRQTLWLAALLFALLVLLVVFAYVKSWPLENWIAAAIVVALVIAGGLGYGPVKHLQDRAERERRERRERGNPTVHDGPPSVRVENPEL